MQEITTDRNFHNKNNRTHSKDSTFHATFFLVKLSSKFPIWLQHPMTSENTVQNDRNQVDKFMRIFCP